MKVSQHWAKTPTHKNHSEISDEFGFFFAKHLPNFFKGGVSLRQIREAMPPKLFKKFCKEQNITWVDHGKYIQEIKNNQEGN